MAENHPVGFQWVMEAREKGAKIIHVDPRYTRTSAMADVWVPLRAGSDIIFLGALVQLRSREPPGVPRLRGALHQRVDDSARGFSRHRRSRRFLLRMGCRKGKVQSESLALSRLAEPRRPRKHLDIPKRAADTAKTAAGKREDSRQIESDPTLQHPRCVFQVLKRHFSRYTPEMVERYCGVPQDVFSEDGRYFHFGIRAREDRSHLLRSGLDAALQRRADHSHRSDPAIACSATSGGRVAAFSRCAVTPPFRVRPTFPRSTTSCPATCRCRSSRRTRTN